MFFEGCNILRRTGTRWSMVCTHLPYPTQRPVAAMLDSIRALFGQRILHGSSGQQLKLSSMFKHTGKHHSHERSLLWACVIGVLRGRCRNSSVHLPHCKAFVLLTLVYQAGTCEPTSALPNTKICRGPGTSNGETTPTPHGRCLPEKRAAQDLDLS